MGGIKEVLRCLQHCHATLVVHDVAYRFPGWGVVRMGQHVWCDLNRALGGHRESAVRLLHSKKGHGIAKIVNGWTPDLRLWQYHQLITEAALMCTVAWPEIHCVVTD